MDIKSTITTTTQNCIGNSPILDSIQYVTFNPNIRMYDALQGVLGKENTFDYIEYNGGISLSADFKEHLHDLSKVAIIIITISNLSMISNLI